MTARIFAFVIVALLEILALRHVGEPRHPLAIDAHNVAAPNIPPCAAVPMCKPQGEVDCLRNRTQEIV